MKKAYIYPNNYKKQITNPYLNDFIESLSPYINFVNEPKSVPSGIIDLLNYINRIDFIFLNWIEDLPDKKGGIFQTTLFLMLLLIMKLKGIKIFYVLHNKESHYSSNKFLKNTIRKAIFRNADYIICHSSEGLNLSEKIKTKNIKYIPHPFNSFNRTGYSTKKEYDILIWGSIRPYKGIDNYLKYLESKNLLNKYKLLIIGKIFPPEYETELMKYNSGMIQIENKFIDDSNLNDLIAKSKLVLFTYNEKSVLSSGALVYSLSQGALVIGPKTGAFQDLNSEGIINVFENYDDLIEKIDFQLSHQTLYPDKISEFVKNNSWQSFGIEIGKWISR